jgi:ketosteroid isomerase-like protein
MKSFTRKTALAAVLAASTAIASCSQKAAAPEAAAKLSEAEAAVIADATEAAWTSADLAKEEAVYAKDVIAFDPADPPLSTSWENFDKLQKAYIDMKFNGKSVPDRTIQILDADTFVVSGTADLTSIEGPMKQASMRFTDVYQHQADGRWLIVNEHVSFRPEPAKAVEPALAR